MAARKKCLTLSNRNKKPMLIRELELPANHLAPMEAFYHGLLELPVVRRTAADISFAAGHSVLTFRRGRTTDAIYHFAFLIPQNKLEEAYRWLKARTPVLPYNAGTDIADFTNWNAHAFYFHDPQQNIVEFIAHHDLPNASAAAFSAAALIGLHEGGIVAQDVGRACALLKARFGIPYFRKGPVLQDFAVMGDDQGLLIVSGQERGWIPTGQKGGMEYQRLVLEHGGRRMELLMQDIL